MTAIAVNEADMDLSVVGAPVVQATIPCLEDITAGAPVRRPTGRAVSPGSTRWASKAEALSGMDRSVAATNATTSMTAFQGRAIPAVEVA